MAFKIELLADVADVLRATGQVEVSLEDVAAALDQLGRDTETSAETAGRDLEDEYTRALNRVTDEAKNAGRQIGDDLEAGTDKAGKGLDGLATTAGDTAKAAADAFRGEFDAAAGVVEDKMTSALASLGPAGGIAGAAAAAGLTILQAHLEAVAEAAAKAKDEAIALSNDLDEVGGNAELLDWLDRVKTRLNEVVDDQKWWEVWQDAPVTRMEQVNDALRELGMSASDFGLGMTGLPGSTEAADRVLAGLNERLAALGTSFDELDAHRAGGILGDDDDYARTANAALYLRDTLQEQNGVLAEANRLYEIRDGIMSSATTTTDAQKAAIEAEAEAVKEAQRASQEWSAALADHLSVADEGLARFVAKGKLNLKDWAAELKARAADVEVIEDFSVDIAPKLSPAALAAFAALPAETQLQIAKAYEDGGDKDKALVVQNLEAEVKVSPRMEIDTTEAQAAAVPIEVPATIVTAGLPAEVAAAAAGAQFEADRHTITLEVRLGTTARELQRAVDQLVASIRPPVIYADIKPKRWVA